MGKRGESAPSNEKKGLIMVNILLAARGGEEGKGKNPQKKGTGASTSSFFGRGKREKKAYLLKPGEGTR